MTTIASVDQTSWNELLYRLTVDELKVRARLLPGRMPGGAKAALVDAIRAHLSGSALRDVWGRLDAIQQLAVAEALHGSDGWFESGAFHAKHGQLPAFNEPSQEKGWYSSGKGPATVLQLFFYPADRRRVLPDELRKELAAFVAAPAPMQLTPLDVLPAQAGDQAPAVHHCEHDALLDLPALLRLVGQGRLQVSEKTALPGAAAQRVVAEALAGGDFYPDPPAGADGSEAGPIKAFAWPLLLQAAGLAVRQAGKLVLSPAGTKALAAPPAEVLRTVWQKWLKSNLLDEFSRVDEIKGQKSQGRVMAAVAPRRAAIDAALRECPIGAWVAADEFSRFMLAEGFEFDVAHDPWKLYIGELQYGNLGHDWNVLQFRYLLCVLMEYAAPLGLVDVAVVPPDGARSDFRRLWGVDDLPFLSRYDGLFWFRLTPLGAYCLGLRDAYAPAVPQAGGARLSVMPSLLVNLAAGALQKHEAMLLETWAEPVSPQSWRLDRQRALAAVESGQDSSELRAFLQARDEQPLPETVESFITGCQAQGRALRMAGPALLVECRDADTAAAIAVHKETAGLCLRAGDTHLVVRPAHERKFRERVRVLGFGVQG